MEEQKAANLSTQLNVKLRELCPVPSEFSICRVPNLLRKVKRKVYEPQIVSIGPYHRGKPHLLKMEEFKMQYLRQLLLRRRQWNETHEEAVRSCVKAIGALEQRARKCYHELNNFDSEEFVRMLLLDACFIIELIWSHFDHVSMKTNLKFVLKLNFQAARGDLLLLENQLPFFVVLELCDQIEMPVDFTSICIQYLKAQYPGFEVDPRDSDRRSFAHLLDMLHRYWLPFDMKTEIRGMEKRDEQTPIPCATELREAGIELRKADDDKKGSSTFDVRFDNGILKIPTFIVDDGTETLLRNLIAYEQLPVAGEVSYVTDYTTLVDNLINTTKDVQLLSQSGIINNYLGDDKVIAALFNRIRDNVFLHSEFFCYSELFNKVQNHCSKKRNKWKAKLWHDHCSSPWTLISLFGAVTLLVLTLLQTVFTVASYFHSNN